MYCGVHDSHTCDCYDSVEKIETAIQKSKKAQANADAWCLEAQKSIKLMQDVPAPIVCTGCGRALIDGKCPLLSAFGLTRHM